MQLQQDKDQYIVRLLSLISKLAPENDEFVFDQYFAQCMFCGHQLTGSRIIGDNHHNTCPYVEARQLLEKKEI